MHDHRADAGVGEDLEQEHVGDPAVEDVGAVHAVADGVGAAGDLGDHAAGDRAVGDELVEFVGGGLADQAGGVGDVAAQALDVGEVDQLLGAERLGDRAGDGVGVDVVRLTGLVAADRGDHGDELVVEQPVDHLGVDLGDVADEAELRVAGGRPDQAGVDAADADGVAAVHVDRGDELRVDLPLEHHAGDVDGLGVGDPQAVDELGFLAEPFHQLGDLRTAAVHDDRAHPDEAHQHDVLGEQGERIVVGGAGEGIAAVLDDDGLAGEPPDVRQRLDEDRRLERCRSAVERSRCESDRGEAGGLVEAERDVGGLDGSARGALGRGCRWHTSRSRCWSARRSGR